MHESPHFRLRREGPLKAAAFWFGLLNLLIGVSGFLGPLVTGNEEGLINIDTGQLLGLVAINWAHALLFVAFGLYGIATRSPAAATYFLTVAVVFGLLASLGILAHVRWLRVTGPEGTPVVFEIAVNWAGTLLHLVWAGAGLLGFFGATRSTVHREQPAQA